MKHFIPPRGLIKANARTPAVARGLHHVKADGTVDLNSALAEIKTAFEEFKGAVKNETAEVVKAGVADVITADKVERINSSIEEMQTAMQTTNEKLAMLEMGQPDDGDGVSEKEKAYTKIYDNWMRTGEEADLKLMLREGEVRAATSVGSDPDGGHLSPVEWDRTITDELQSVSAFRQNASVQSVTGQGFRKLYNLHGVTSGWVGETDPRPETNTPQLAPYDFAFGEIYANPAATQRSLEDPEISVADWLSAEVRTKFAMDEATAFMTGDGVNKPKGFLNYDETTETALPAAQRHPLGWIKEVNTGAAAAMTLDGLIDLIYDLDDERTAGARFYMNKLTASVFRKMKNGDGDLIWNPPVSQGEPDTLLGENIVRISNMPNVAANAVPVAYGNMSETYRIFDRVGVSVLRDPFTNKPYVHFYTRKRIGGGLWNPEWMRYHRVAA